MLWKNIYAEIYYKNELAHESYSRGYKKYLIFILGKLFLTYLICLIYAIKKIYICMPKYAIKMRLLMSPIHEATKSTWFFILGKLYPIFLMCLIYAMKKCLCLNML